MKTKKQALKLLEKANVILAAYPLDRTSLVVMISELTSDMAYQARLEAEQKRLPRKGDAR